MTMRNAFLTSLMGFAAVLNLHAAAGDTYELTWSAFSGGGGFCRSATYIQQGTLGLPSPGLMASDSYELQLGNPDLPIGISEPGGPVLTIARVATFLQISWPLEYEGYLLEEAAEVNGVVVWTRAQGVYATSLQEGTHIFRMVPSEARRFYRLRKDTN